MSPESTGINRAYKMLNILIVIVITTVFMGLILSIIADIFN